MNMINKISMLIFIIGSIIAIIWILYATLSKRGMFRDNLKKIIKIICDLVLGDRLITLSKEYQRLYMKLLILR